MPVAFQPQKMVFATQQFLIVKRNTDYPYGVHYHDFYEFHYISQGKGELLYNDKKYAFEQGDIIAVNVFTPHKLTFDLSSQPERYSIAFDYNFVVFFDAQNSMLFSVFNESSRGYPIIKTTRQQSDELLAIMKRFENNDFVYGKQTLEVAICLEFLMTTFNIVGCDIQTSAVCPRNLEIMSNLISYINENLAGVLSLDRLASYISISKFYLSRLFKQFTGRTLSHYIVAKRLERSKQLILENVALTEVMRNTGFHNYSYFYKSFKNLTGVSPREYRKLAGAPLPEQRETDKPQKPYPTSKINAAAKPFISMMKAGDE